MAWDNLPKYFQKAKSEYPENTALEEIRIMSNLGITKIILELLQLLPFDLKTKTDQRPRLHMRRPR
jgi:hypothetical protein